MIIKRKLFSITGSHNKSERRKARYHEDEDLNYETIELPWGDSETVITDSRGQLIEKITRH